MTPITGLDINEIIDRHIETAENPAPMILAAAIAEELDDEVAWDLVIEAIGHRVSSRLHQKRMRVLGGGEGHRKKLAVTTPPAQGEKKKVAQSEIMQVTVAVNHGQQKRVARLTITEVKKIRKRYQNTADANQRIADRFDNLAKTMEAAKVKTAGQLGAEKLEEIFQA